MSDEQVSGRPNVAVAKEARFNIAVLKRRAIDGNQPAKWHLETIMAKLHEAFDAIEKAEEEETLDDR